MYKYPIIYDELVDKINLIETMEDVKETLYLIILAIFQNTSIPCVKE